MANSIITVLGDGSTVQYALNFTLGVLKREYVTCRVGDEVDGLGDPVYRELEWVTDGLVNIQGAVPGDDVPIVFKRTMPKSSLIHDYSDGAAIIEANLDQSNLQHIMSIHEFLDGRLEGGFVQDITMNDYRITDLGDGVDAGDAVNKAQLDAVEDLAVGQSDLAEAWATKTDGVVADSEYSAKAYSVGGTGVTDTSGKGAAKEWATKTGSTVDTAGYSAKEHATGDLTVTGGSAKAWAVDASSPNGTSDKSAKSYAADTAADVVLTHADVVLTHADVVLTHADVVSAAASAASAASSASQGLYREVATIDFSNSPFVPALNQEGYIWRVDCTSGNVVINLSALSVYGEDMKFAFVKIDGTANTITINRGGSDTIRGATSLVLTQQWEAHLLLGDFQTGTWIDTIQALAIADNSITTVKYAANSVTNAKMAQMAAATFKMRALGAGTGDPIDGTAAQANAALGNVPLAKSATVTLSGIGQTIACTSGAMRHRFTFAGVSSSGNSGILFRLLDSGVKTSGYVTTLGYVQNTNQAGVSTSTSSMTQANLTSGADVITGDIELTLHDLATNTWFYTVSVVNPTSSYMQVAKGYIALSSALTAVGIYTTNGSDTLDAGTISKIED